MGDEILRDIAAVRGSAVTEYLRAEVEDLISDPRFSQSLRETANGAFWSCSAFPRCFSSRPLKQDEWKSLESAD